MARVPPGFRRKRARGGRADEDEDKEEKRARGGRAERDDEDEEEKEKEEKERARGGRTNTVVRARGGKVPAGRKSGGAIGGAGEKGGLATRARGGVTRGVGSFARGGSPLSVAAHTTPTKGGGAGHEGADNPRGVP